MVSACRARPARSRHRPGMPGGRGHRRVGAAARAARRRPPVASGRRRGRRGRWPVSTRARAELPVRLAHVGQRPPGRGRHLPHHGRAHPGRAPARAPHPPTTTASPASSAAALKAGGPPSPTGSPGGRRGQPEPGRARRRAGGQRGHQGDRAVLAGQPGHGVGGVVADDRVEDAGRAPRRRAARRCPTRRGRPTRAAGRSRRDEDTRRLGWRPCPPSSSSPTSPSGAGRPRCSTRSPGPSRRTSAGWSWVPTAPGRPRCCRSPRPRSTRPRGSPASSRRCSAPSTSSTCAPGSASPAPPWPSGSRATRSSTTSSSPRRTACWGAGARPTTTSTTSGPTTCWWRSASSTSPDRTFGTLSEGERKRVQIARSLMTDPELLLLDEPAAGLDLGGREDLVSTLTVLANDPDSPATVLVSHHVEEIPPGFTHALLLRDGRVVAAGPIDRGRSPSSTSRRRSGCRSCSPARPVATAARRRHATTRGLGFRHGLVAGPLVAGVARHRASCWASPRCSVSTWC